MGIGTTPRANRPGRGTYGVARGRRGGGFAVAPHFWRRLVSGRWLLATIVVLLAIGVMIGLGVWQLDRLQGRRAANAAITRQLAAPPIALDGQTAKTSDAAALTFRRVSLRGTWDFAHEVELRYRSFDGQAGVHLLTPLRIEGSDTAVLVDRGWIPYQQAAAENRRVYQQGDRAIIEGLVHESIHQQTPSSEPGTVSQIDLAAIGAQVSYPLLTYWVQRLPASEGEPLPRSEGLPDLSDGSHLAYMVQWWAFAATLLVTYLVFANQTMRKVRKEARSTKLEVRTG